MYLLTLIVSILLLCYLNYLLQLFIECITVYCIFFKKKKMDTTIIFIM